MPAAVLLTVGLAAQGGVPAAATASDLAGLHVVLPREEVEFGRAFTLVVVRTWGPDSTPSPFDPATLKPLGVDLEGTRTEARDGGSAQTLTFTARAFVRDAVELAPWFELRASDGSVRRVQAAPTTLTVRSALGSPPALDPEFPDLLEPAGRRTWPWLLAGAAAGLALVAVWLVGRRRTKVAAPSPPPAPPESAAARALAALAALRAHARDGLADVVRFHVEASAIVRRFLAARFQVAAPNLTTAEAMAAVARVPRLSAATAASLARVLDAADQVKFACHLPTAEAMASLLDDAFEFVHAAAAAADVPLGGDEPDAAAR